MIVTFTNKMIVTFGPWLKGEGAWSTHRSKPFGPWLKWRVLGQHTCPLRTASEITVRLYIPTTTTTNDDDDEDDM